jgi:putative oxidoreductase
MNFVERINNYFSSRSQFGHIFLRVAIGWRLIEGTQDNVFNWQRMLEFRDFLQQHGVAAPLFAAQVSVWAQFICGILILVGAFIRPAAAIMIINFIAALLIAHIGTTFQQSFDAIVILAASVFFLFSGAGRISIDSILFKRNYH